MLNGVFFVAARILTVLVLGIDPKPALVQSGDTEKALSGFFVVQGLHLVLSRQIVITCHVETYPVSRNRFSALLTFHCCVRLISDML